jgi:hypothetical protein
LLGVAKSVDEPVKNLGLCLRCRSTHLEHLAQCDRN